MPFLRLPVQVLPVKLGGYGPSRLAAPSKRGRRRAPLVMSAGRLCRTGGGVCCHCVGYGLVRSRAVLSLVVRLVSGAVVALADGADVRA